MRTWDDYKNHVRKANPAIGIDTDEVETVSRTAYSDQITRAMADFNSLHSRSRADGGASGKLQQAVGEKKTPPNWWRICADDRKN